MRRLPLFAAIAALACAGPALAAGTKVTSSAALARKAEALKPGEWVWGSSLAPKGPVLVYVDLGRQQAHVYRNGIRIGVSTISSGKPGHETPNGVFTILEKAKVHHSRTYDNAPMPNMQRLTWKGVALHAGNLPGFPASHGCVRLPLAFSEVLFNTTDKGGTVVIAGRAGAPHKRPPAGLLAPASLTGHGTIALPLGDKQAFSWQPQLSPTGPVSIIVSTADQAVVILRNGVEIGRARAVIQQDNSENQVLTMSRDRKGRAEWIQVGVTNLAPEEAAIVSTRGVEQMQLPQPFVAHMRSVMQPGATVLITSASMSAGSLGEQTTVIASD
ncbi:L,D-transpeptidase family protein [Sphingomonas mesophila]|uniref:L,D-transpeptidase family protein n=1 Tax=Sphingomonas mesophila TaxID=2303576 RepID=UPI000E594BA5|nr:L,D-transpeptidase family protein [Sphingomonas mesophila]